MLASSLVEVIVDGRCAKYYRAKGYHIPTRDVQLWMTGSDGRRCKNGIDRRVARGTKIMVRVEDLLPSSNKSIEFDCPTCGGRFTTTWGAHRKKKSNNCKSCQAKKGFRGGCHSYWVERLIANSPNAACDISGETDKRFLELHHLRSRSLGGRNERNNYVILSANLHRAFHNWMGGSTAPCVADDYFEFKRLELSGSAPTRRVGN